MSRFRSEDPDCKVYVGDLSTHASKQDVEDAFSYYGPIRNVWVARNPPGFAFVEFEDVRDAEDAVKEVDGGRNVCGKRVRVERAGGKRGGGRGFRRPFRRGGSRGRPYRPEDRCYECGNRGHYARECRRDGGRRSRGRRSYSRSASRSNSRDRRSRSRDRRSRSKGGRRSRSASTSRSRSPSRSRNNRDNSRSRSVSRHNDRSRPVRNNKSASRDKSVSRSKSRSRTRSPKTKERRDVNGESSN